MALTTTLIASLVNAFTDHGSLSASDLTSSGYAVSSTTSTLCPDGTRALSGNIDRNLALANSNSGKLNVACAQSAVSTKQ